MKGNGIYFIAGCRERSCLAEEGHGGGLLCNVCMYCLEDTMMRCFKMPKEGR
jgi:hypothetical protein